MKEAFLSATGRIDFNTSVDGVGRCGHKMVYVFARSDTLLLSPIDIPLSGIGNKDIYVPGWQSCKRCINDRFAVAGPSAANVYAAAKSVAFKGMVLEQRKRKGSLEDLRGPEKMLQKVLTKSDVNLTVHDPSWAHLGRVRSGGVMTPRDADEFHVPRIDVRDLSFVWTPSM